MKIAIMSKGEYIGSDFCNGFEECEYIIIYDTKMKTYGSRKNPAFNTKDPELLKKFFKQIFIKHIISKPFETKFFKIFTPAKAETVEEAIEEFLNNN